MFEGLPFKTSYLKRPSPAGMGPTSDPKRPSRAADRGKEILHPHPGDPPHNEPFWAPGIMQVIHFWEGGGPCSFWAYNPHPAQGRGCLKGRGLSMGPRPF